MALLRFFGLSLAGDAGLVDYLPVIALTYFSLTPRPRFSAWYHVAVSTLVLVVGAARDFVELMKWPHVADVRFVELALLAIACLAQVAYVFTRRGQGMEGTVIGPIPIDGAIWHLRRLSMSKDFLVLYDYGMGGSWALIEAKCGCSSASLPFFSSIASGTAVPWSG